MIKRILIWLIAIFHLLSFNAYSRINEEKTGAWYMYFWNTNLEQSSFGFQGDIQYRNWNAIGDLDQLLLRGGLTFTPSETEIKFTLGYAHIISGEYGDNDGTTMENRIYQESLIPQTIGKRFYLMHRFRFEQRFVESQLFRTRWRYNIFINVPLNQTDLKKGAVYFSFYNELFINGERKIGSERSVEIFDRNRTYGALGYSLSDKLKLQLGYMIQTTDSWRKGQIQFSIHY